MGPVHHVYTFGPQVALSPFALCEVDPKCRLPKPLRSVQGSLEREPPRPLLLQGVLNSSVEGRQTFGDLLVHFGLCEWVPGTLRLGQGVPLAWYLRQVVGLLDRPYDSG